MEIEKKISRSISPDVEKEKLLLQVVRVEERRFRFSEFYILDFRTGQVSDCPFLLFANYGYNSVVALGSVIYIFGSPKLDNVKPPDSITNHKKDLYHKGISFLDLGGSDCEEGWKVVPYVSKDLSIIHSVVAFAGKLYLFHSGTTKSKAVKVFDPISNKWEKLLPPPQVRFFKISHTKSAVADHENNRILVSFLSIKSVFAYYRPTNPCVNQPKTT